VWEWCEDIFQPKAALNAARVMRGAAFDNAGLGTLLSSYRDRHTAWSRSSNFGFRVVLGISDDTSAKAKGDIGPDPLRVPRPNAATSAEKPRDFLVVATKDQPFVNTLGMKFVPVPITGGPTGGKRVLFSVWETRVQDYEVFVKETEHSWQKPKFEQGPTHPVVKVSWDDAQAFCVWLTERERKAGRLGAAERYRLPTDHEWSCAVGIGDREDPAIGPAGNFGKLLDVFPWGTAWPPPPGAGNYSGEEATGHELAPDQKIITGYRDAFPYTAPAGSFAANKLGIFDLGGNTWEWCEDRWKTGDPSRVVRGGSFGSSRRNGLACSHRDFKLPDARSSSFGFRVVVDVSDPNSRKAATGGDKASPAPSQSAATAATTLPATTPATATKDRPFVNTLGMQFVPVPITGGPTDGKRVLFSVWKARVQDYEIFAKETKRVWWKTSFDQGPTHPAVNVTWEDARIFCEWLTERDRKAGRLSATQRYRLPTDHEWSCAVGIGGREDAAQAPMDKHRKLADVFPWGANWPPLPGAGNFHGEESAGQTDAPKQDILTGYRDAFPYTAPVGSFPANRFGLFDLEGNAQEWCQDLWSPGDTTRVARGGSFFSGRRAELLSSNRARGLPVAVLADSGVRPVLDEVPSTPAGAGTVLNSTPPPQ